jgi:hypothetical protein
LIRPDRPLIEDMRLNVEIDPIEALVRPGGRIVVQLA